MREGQSIIAEVILTGRAGTALRQTDDLVTRQTGPPGLTVAGRLTRWEPGDDAPTKRSIEMENSAATVLADRGWLVEQNPSREQIAAANRISGDQGDPRKKPDFLLEGRVFDCYSPTNPAKKVRGIWDEVEAKVISLQTQRVVVNLEDWRGDLAALRKQFADWPIGGLKEVKAITPDGDIVQIDLPTE